MENASFRKHYNSLENQWEVWKDVNGPIEVCSVFVASLSSEQLADSVISVIESGQPKQLFTFNPRTLAYYAMIDLSKTLAHMRNDMMHPFGEVTLLYHKYQHDVRDDYNSWADYDSLPFKMAIIQRLLRENCPYPCLPQYVESVVEFGNCGTSLPCVQTQSAVIKELCQWLSGLMKENSCYQWIDLVV